jgi:hypothetical protein
MQPFRARRVIQIDAHRRQAGHGLRDQFGAQGQHQVVAGQFTDIPLPVDPRGASGRVDGLHLAPHDFDAERRQIHQGPGDRRA